MTRAEQTATGKQRSAPAIERIERALARAWRGVVTIVATVAPAWPLWGGVILAGWALFLTGQGRQAVIAVLAGDGERWRMFGATFFILALHSLIICAGFLEATRHRDEVRGEGLRRHRLRRQLAVISALLLPAMFLIFVTLNIWPQSFIDLNDAAPLVAIATLIVLLAPSLSVLSLRYFRVKETAFGQIATLDGKVTALLTVLSVAGAVFAVIVGYFPAVRNAIGPVSIFVLAVAIYGLWMTRAVTWLRIRHLPPLVIWVGFFLLGGVLYAQIPGRAAYHAIETIKSDEKPTPIEEHARAWLEERSSGDDDTPIPAIIVLAEGGGIYAAANAAASLARLDELSDDEFHTDVFALSGVSGGSVGIAAYLAARADIEEPSQRVKAINAFMSNDFLSPLAAGLLFRDIPFRFMPGADLLASAVSLPSEDRARLFESELSRQWLKNCPSGAPCRDRFHESLFKVSAEANRKGSQTGPVILLNAARESDGRVETISTVSFGKHSEARLANLLDRNDGTTVPLAAAAHVSARFPIISPRAIAEIGSSDERITLVDGGYADNSGATAATFAIEVLLDQAERLDVSKRLKVVLIHFYSRAIVDKEKPLLTDRVDVVAEVFGPVRAALAVQSRRSAQPVEILCRAASPGVMAGDFCRSLTGSREIQTEQSDPNERDEIIKAISVGAGGVIWIRSPLDISVRARDEGFVPLGWYLGGSGGYVAEETTRRSCKISRSLAELTALSIQLNLECSD